MGCRRMGFDVRHRMYLHALLEKPFNESISKPCVEVRSPDALNSCDLSSQNVTMIIASFVKVAIKASIPTICRLLLDGSK